MANKTKYVSLDKLGLYDEKIKTLIGNADTAVLNSAKEYANGLATNYDAAGSAATVQGNLDTEIARAKAEEERIAGLVKTAQDEVDALELVVDTKADKTALEGFQNTVSSTYETKEDAGKKLTEAKTYTDTEVKKATDAVSALAGKVGEVAEGSTVVEMIGAVEDVAEANAGAIEVLEGKVQGLIEGTYDDTEIRGLITANAEAIEALEGVHADDKSELEGKIDLKADKTALEEEVNRAKGVEGGLEDRIETMEAFWEAALADEEGKNVIDTLKEIQDYIAGDESGASEMAASIKQNADDIDALEGRMDSAEQALGTVDSRISAAITGANLGQYALDSDLDAAVERIAELETADGVQDGLIAGLRTDVDLKATQADHEALAGRVGTAEGKISGLETKVDVEKVSTAIATTKQEAIDAAAADATSKANAAESNAKGHADGLNTAMNARVEALEAIDHEHSNKALLDTYTQTEANLADAVAKKHEHSNLSVLETLTAAKVAAWDAAEQAAKTYADGLNSAMDSRVTTLETWHSNFVECSQEDINGLFD